MRITAYQAAHSPSTVAAIAGKQLTGAEPFTLDKSVGDLPATDVSAVHSSHATLDPGTEDLKEAFHDFVGQTFFGEMIKSFRSAQQPSKYFNGGRAEEIFQGQLDQALTEKLSDASAEAISGPMYDLFMLKRSS